MTSVLINPQGVFESEAAHGTVTRHFREHQKGKQTSTNSIASIFAWSRALQNRGVKDNNSELIKFAEKIEQETIKAVEDGIMTKDLALIIHKDQLNQSHYVNTQGFIEEVEKRLKRGL